MLDVKKMEERYLLDRHFHVTYFKHGYDIEGTAWKKRTGCGWDVLFSDIYNDIVAEDGDMDIVIFHWEEDDLDYEKMNEMFARWVARVLLPNAKNKSAYAYKEI